MTLPHAEADSLAELNHLMKILVTGGAGYIGSHTAKVLASAGLTPIVFDDLRQGHRQATQWGPLIEGDLADRKSVERIFRDHSIQGVIHFAGSASVGESMRDPGLYFRNNLINSLQLLEIMKAAGVLRIVFSSTCATYGQPGGVTISEQQPQLPVNPYGESKLAIEKALRWYGELHGFSWTALRYFNAAGADQEGRVGETHFPETHLIPLAMQAALGAIHHLDVYGTDYDTPDGTAIRDYVHVTDLGQAHLSALRYLQDGGASGAFNLGTGRGHSVLEVIAMIEKISRRPVLTNNCPRRPGDPPVLIADPSRAFAAFAWQPQMSSLETIIETAWRWHSRNSP